MYTHYKKQEVKHQLNSEVYFLRSAIVIIIYFFTYFLSLKSFSMSVQSDSIKSTTHIRNIFHETKRTQPQNKNQMEMSKLIKW